MRRNLERERQNNESKGRRRAKAVFFSVMQPLYCPELDELMDKRIDVLYSFQLGSGEKAL